MLATTPSLSPETPVPPSTVPLHAKFRRMIDEIDALNVRRRTEAEIMALALACGMHLCALGKPGTGKTRIIDQFMARITDARLFSLCMGRQTDVAEVRGPQSIPALRDGELVFLTADYLPGAHVGKLDEVFKANSGTLNHLLPLMEEGVITNNGRPQRCNTSTIFGASNELPKDDDLAALKDRFFFWLWVDEIHEPGDIERLLRIRYAERTAPKVVPTPILTWADVEAAKDEIAALPVTDAVFAGLVKVFQQLRHGPADAPPDAPPLLITPSNRRMAKCIDVVQAWAWLQGAPAADDEHLEVLVHVLWDDPDQRRDVERVVLGVCSPGRKAAVLLADRLGELADDVNKALAMPIVVDGQPSEKRAAAITEVNAKCGWLIDEVAQMEAGAVGTTARMVAELADRAHALAERIFDEGIQGMRHSRRGRAA